jgi:hypothetical protein
MDALHAQVAALAQQISSLTPSPHTAQTNVAVTSQPTAATVSAAGRRLLYKPIPPPTWDGSIADGFKAEQWLVTALDFISRYSEESQADQCSYFTDLLSGQARLWLLRQHPLPATLLAMETAFRCRFIPTHLRHAARDRLLRITAAYFSSTAALDFDLQSVKGVLGADLSDTEMLSRFIEALPFALAKEVKAEDLRSGPITYTHALSLARMHEDMSRPSQQQHHKSAQRTAHSMQVDEDFLNAISRPMECWICGQDHRAFECARAHCIFCGKVGHKANICRDRPAPNARTQV